MFPYYDLTKRLEGLDLPALTALDLGCGRYESDVARVVPTLPWKKLTSVDVFQPNIDILKERGLKHELVCADLRDYVAVHGAGTDVVLMFDVLEHLPKEDGEVLLRRAIREARQRVVVFVPVEPTDFHRKNIWPENPAEDHVSHWDVQDFRDAGFDDIQVIGNVHVDYREDGSRIEFGAIWAIKHLG